MPSHRIRLAGPWEIQSLNNNQQPAGDIVRIQLPWTSSDSDPSRSVLLQRAFHRPTGITNNSSLRIVLKASSPPAAVCLNAASFAASSLDRVATEDDRGTNCMFTYDVTQKIDPFNRLSIVLQNQPESDLFRLESAWLEIIEPV